MLAFKYELFPTYIEGGQKAVILASDLRKLEEIALRCIHQICHNKTQQNPPGPGYVPAPSGSKVQVLADNRQFINMHLSDNREPEPPQNRQQPQANPANDRKMQVYRSNWYINLLKAPMFSNFDFKTEFPLSFLSSRLSQFTKATKLFSTRDHTTKTNVAKEFHEACDGKTNTLVIIKSGQYIAGGYTEVAWSSPSTAAWFPVSSESGAFLFSVNKQKVYQNKKISDGMYCDAGLGPCFGGGCDLGIAGNHKSDGNLSNLNVSYDASGVSEPKKELFESNHFTIDEYEVYKLE